MAKNTNFIRFTDWQRDKQNNSFKQQSLLLGVHYVTFKNLRCENPRLSDNLKLRIEKWSAGSVPADSWINVLRQNSNLSEKIAS